MDNKEKSVSLLDVEKLLNQLFPNQEIDKCIKIFHS